ncbi:MerR family transcriptional regulator [Kitasatospora atroaurantiaca]|uniref:DNA-binding transcriptional MerR regulator n=1 Tax=Kitasatospora atroaurantiaca TaxID=285545 RepID=A0A561EUE5_9ACTN|nr:MerR family transcriptional regulator [Kitasatospora atroaurantiaca]TWE19228.1 DNA-binding transcriptional MerR regulator [Kitasatospora atroaurantiaca]
MDDDTLRTIGDLARLTGLTVKTIRFWSDAGVVPPTDRTPAGYRLYGRDALARLDLVRTLRDLGVDLATIQRVLEREVTVAEVAAAHAEALDVQIRTLRLRRAVLRAVARRGSTPEEMELMHKLAKLSDQERRRLINDFIDEAFEGLDVGPEFVAKMRGAMPELPDDPSPEQADAWVELAELVQDRDFRAGIRRAASYQARERAEGVQTGTGADRQLVELVLERTGVAREAGIEPAAEAARPVVDELAGSFAELFGRADGPEFRAWLLERMVTGNDPRYERYWQLIAVINGWPVGPSLGPAFDWLVAALRAGLQTA